MIAILFIILAFLLFFGSTLCIFTANYLVNTLQVTSFSQILFNLNFGVEGSSSEVWSGAIAAYFRQYGLLLLLVGSLCLCLFGFVLYLKKVQKVNIQAKKWLKTMAISSVVLSLATGFTFAGSAYNALDQVGYFSYQNAAETPSNFYETYYVPTSTDLLTWPEKQKNLIIIWSESLETAVASLQNGGYEPLSVIPNLERLALENSNFAAKGSIGGAHQTVNTSWTIAGLMAESAGVPLAYNSKMTIYNWEEEEAFMPGITTLGDLLDSQGYENVLRIGSEAAYAGRSNYFRQHGDYTILDYQQAVDNGLIPEGYRVWWGYEDAKLFDFAKQDLTSLSQSDKPFNYNILTTDTHFPGGYQCPDCDLSDEYDLDIERAYACSDKRISEFIQWIQQQPFYEDTVIMLAGDHISMDEDLASKIQDYSRKVYFTLINAPKSANEARTFTTMDIFPTVLSALGVTIEGDRLGLGTNLYSGKPTLVETLGLQELNDQLSKSSDYFIEEVMNLKEMPKELITDEPAEGSSQETYQELPAEYYELDFYDQQQGWNDSQNQVPEYVAPQEPVYTPSVPSVPENDPITEPETPEIPAEPDLPAEIPGVVPDPSLPAENIPAESVVEIPTDIPSTVVETPVSE